MPAAKPRDPRTKEELLNKMLSYDFSGDIRELGVKPATLERTKRNAMLIHFPDSGATFELQVRKPREFAKVSKSRTTIGAPKGQEELEEEQSASPAKRKTVQATTAARGRVRRSA